ncbi:hypothetical protein EG68_11111 [Paragonimus skrjabini miyazakii]|uniref:Uncharacterized protein n=1 Tax=Paragonimus skrjabini miyazakii TaxID=59628 RepID=A0A8S9YEA6_9TREM|nr:hypothetical protein EG68_11111 [Paragonimus skrjabini miyazakii]
MAVAVANVAVAAAVAVLTATIQKVAVVQTTIPGANQRNVDQLWKDDTGQEVILKPERIEVSYLSNALCSLVLPRKTAVRFIFANSNCMVDILAFNLGHTSTRKERRNSPSLQ